MPSSRSGARLLGAAIALVLSVGLLVVHRADAGAVHPLITKITGFGSGLLQTKASKQVQVKVRVVSGGRTMRRPAKLQRKIGNRWKTLQSKRTDRRGRVTFRWKAPARSTQMKIRILAPAAKGASRKVTAARTVKVKKKLTQTQRFEKRVFELLNEARGTEQNCGGRTYGEVDPLRRNGHLDRAARKHSADMGKRRYFDHTNPDGESPTDRARAEGYSGGVGENIAAGYQTPADVMQGWLDSPGHCANLMSAGYSVVGIGFAEISGSPYSRYWTQNFG